MSIKKSSAYLLITCNVDKRDDVITQIEHLSDIKNIQRTFGAYDIIAKVESATFEHLQKFIVQKIRAVINVKSTMTLHCKANLESLDVRKRNTKAIETVVNINDKLAVSQRAGKSHGV